ncbi:hypothetical protein OIHEL45_08450 [Sulfitobacter indolifex HEL-45]|uniref:Uncharacterized protein n=1 Tax=Sulfitobacter indolifex HEL-45 TaxID=391624 RepID=A0ABM9XB90_9RHOB|nr:hypothetical protein [Sulfitobacter indolifex]EDQ06834.1 hypothetical protein OIHEL45_08450 [Sulfitobacter indolifex HEL-45]
MPPQKLIWLIAEQRFDGRVYKRHAAVGIGHDNRFGHGIHHGLEQAALLAQLATFGLQCQLTAQPTREELNKLYLCITELRRTGGTARKVDRAKQLTATVQRRPDIAFQAEI